MSEYSVVEIFSSINGEGTRAGQLAVFVRFAGCNLKCNYCDTSWANEPDVAVQRMSIEEIVRAVKETGINNVTLTGGEPLLQPDIDCLIRELAKEVHVEIETNGSVDLRPFCDAADENVAFTMDYKLAGSGMEDHMCLSNFELLRLCDTVKFVASDPTDLDRMRELIGTYELGKKCHIYLSPVFGRIEPAQMVEYMKTYRLNEVTLQIQMHKVIWDPNERGV